MRRRIYLHLRHPYGYFRMHWTNTNDRFYEAGGIRRRIALLMTRIEPTDWRNFFS